MGITQKIKNFWNKMRNKLSKHSKNGADSELSAEEVLEEEVYPDVKRYGKDRVPSDTNNAEAQAASDNCFAAEQSTNDTAPCCPSFPADDDIACAMSQTGRSAAVHKSGSTVARKTAKRSRPTNANYKMIDPSDGSCDTGKS